MSNLEDVNIAFISLEEKFEIAAKKALTNAATLGYGFILVKRCSAGYKDIIVKSVLWSEVDDALSEMGVRGARGESYHTKV